MPARRPAKRGGARPAWRSEGPFLSRPHVNAVGRSLAIGLLTLGGCASDGGVASDPAPPGPPPPFHELPLSDALARFRARTAADDETPRPSAATKAPRPGSAPRRAAPAPSPRRAFPRALDPVPPLYEPPARELPLQPVLERSGGNAMSDPRRRASDPHRADSHRADPLAADPLRRIDAVSGRDPLGRVDPLGGVELYRP